MSDNPISPADQVPARRRLLRGSLAVPAVMTLASGSALATTSLTCVQKLNHSPKNAGPSPSGDVWIRVPVHLKKKDNSNYARFVYGNDIESLLARGTYLTSGNWQCIAVLGQVQNTGQPAFTVGSTYTTSQTNTISSHSMYRTSGYVAVRIDSTGKVVGVEGVSTAGSAMSTSCWTSFGGNNAFKV